VIETRRSHTLGRVYWNGSTQPDSGQPDGNPRRVLRAPADGTISNLKKIGDAVNEGDTLAMIDNQHPVTSRLSGVVRGLIREGLHVSKGLKIGDVDTRGDVDACYLVSDKALAIGGGALEAILSKEDIREILYSLHISKT
jgi:xanthine dehydrogenase accessory factor